MLYNTLQSTEYSRQSDGIEWMQRWRCCMFCMNAVHSDAHTDYAPALSDFERLPEAVTHASTQISAVI